MPQRPKLLDSVVAWLIANDASASNCGMGRAVDHDFSLILESNSGCNTHIGTTLSTRFCPIFLFGGKVRTLIATPAAAALIIVNVITHGLNRGANVCGPSL